MVVWLVWWDSGDWKEVRCRRCARSTPPSEMGSWRWSRRRSFRRQVFRRPAPRLIAAVDSSAPREVVARGERPPLSPSPGGSPRRWRRLQPVRIRRAALQPRPQEAGCSSPISELPLCVQRTDPADRHAPYIAQQSRTRNRSVRRARCRQCRIWDSRRSAQVRAKVRRGGSLFSRPSNDSVMPRRRATELRRATDSSGRRTSHPRQSHSVDWRVAPRLAATITIADSEPRALSARDYLIEPRTSGCCSSIRQRWACLRECASFWPRYPESRRWRCMWSRCNRRKR